MTNFFSLQVLLISNDNQSGTLTPSSTNLVYLDAEDNYYSAADFTGQSNFLTCMIYNNELTNLVRPAAPAFSIWTPTTTSSPPRSWTTCWPSWTPRFRGCRPWT